jgi:dCMP deaminase
MIAYVFGMMQAAVDIVLTSPHPTNKIAATLSGKTPDGLDFCVSSTNSWPNAILQHIGHGQEIGNSSGTIHAETECILKAPATKGAELFITDPPCPNCVKNMAEAGIKTLYIDHKGFEKDFALRRGVDFKTLSLTLCREAGITVYELRRKDQKLTLIQKGKTGGANALHKDGLILKPSNDKTAFRDEARKTFGGAPFAAAFAERTGERLGLAVTALTFRSFALDEGHGKYTPVLEPLNRLLIAARREGLALTPDSLYSSRIPTARELVNMVGAGFETLRISDMNSARDIFGPKALKQLTEHKIITVIEEN